MPKDPIFGKHTLLAGETKRFTSADFRMGVRREKEGWTLLFPETTETKPDEPIDFSVGAYYQTGKSNSLIITPALPDKPMVFKGSKLHVSPGQKLTFFLKIPLHIQVYFSKILSENLLNSYAPDSLSRTWFGEPFNGEPAYALGSTFYRSAGELKTSPFEALCPITIFNNSQLVLEVERLIIRGENMALYQNNNQLVSSLMFVEYKGKEVVSTVSFHYAKNFHGEKPDMVTKPRTELSQNLLKINFHFIKNLYKQEF